MKRLNSMVLAMTVGASLLAAPLYGEQDAPRSLPGGVRWLAVYAFLMGSGVAAVNAYLPLYLVERAGATQEMAGAVVATIGLVGIFSRLAISKIRSRVS